MKLIHFRDFALITLTPMALGVVVGCKDSGTITGPASTPTRVLTPSPSRTPTSTPTPAPGSIAGSWSGVVTPDDVVDCISVPVRATFQQTGSAIEGNLETSTDGCFPENISLQGTLTDSTLVATIISSGKYSFHVGSTATGTLSSTTLDIVMKNKTARGLIPGGRMSLHR